MMRRVVSAATATLLLVPYQTLNILGASGFVINGIKQATARGLTIKDRARYDIVEIVPSQDVADMTSQVCARLTLNLIGEMAHQGQIGR